MRNPEISSETARGWVLGMIAAALISTAVYAADAPIDDPVAMAETYEKQAAELRASADRHEKMARMHMQGAGAPKMHHEGVVRHCNKIAESLREAAKESDALAKELRGDAKK